MEKTAIASDPECDDVSKSPLVFAILSFFRTLPGKHDQSYVRRRYIIERPQQIGMFPQRRPFASQSSLVRSPRHRAAEWREQIAAVTSPGT